MMLAFVTSISFLLLAYPCHAQIDYANCQSDSECGAGHCCTIGPIRYSLPQCRPFQDEGDICRPGSVSTLNLTLAYPDGAEITLKNVHYILCPCATGLRCDDKNGVCKDVEKDRDINHVFRQSNDQGD